MEKVHSQGKGAGETAVGGPAKAAETGWTCVEGADRQQGAMRQERSQQLGCGKSACPGQPGEIGLLLLIQLEGELSNCTIFESGLDPSGQ